MRGQGFPSKPMFITTDGSLSEYNFRRVEVYGVEYYEGEPCFLVRFHNGFETIAYGEELA